MRKDLVLSKSNFSIVRLALVALCILASCGRVAVAAQQEAATTNPQISIRADRSSVQIADPFDVIVEVTASDGASVQFPTVPPKLGPFEVIDQQDLFGVPSDSGDGTRKWNRRFTLETLETGERQVPPIEVVVRSEGQSPLRLVTQSLVIEVASVLEPASDPTKFADIHDLIDVPEPTDLSLGWIVWATAGGIGLAALAVGAMVVFRGRTKWTTPADWAIGELASLTADSSQSLSRLEQIVRTYIEEEFHIPATSYSPRELQQELMQRGASQNTSQQLGEFLTRAEQAKYAGLDVSDNEYASAKEAVLEMIKSLDGIPENNIAAISVEVV